MFNFNVLATLLPEEILVYLRKSRADDPSLSTDEVLEKHERLLDEWMEKNLSAPIPEENRFREVVSGESISERTEFQKVLKLIESNKYKAVLVVEISRLGRPDLEEIGRITKVFRYTNTLVITPMMTFNIANEYERDIFERELKRGNEYLEYTKKLLSRGKELSAKSGNFLTRALYGYDKVAFVENKKKVRTLVINEDQANIVRMIFDWYVNENIGTQTIANRLVEMGIPAPASKLWSTDTIRKMISNHHYTGKIVWNSRKTIHVVEDGNIRKARPMNDGDDVIICEGRHEAIISDELFQAAQEKRGRCHRTPVNKELKNPFSTMLYCECGRSMGHSFNRRYNSSTNASRLVCSAQRHCGNASVAVHEIVPFVAKALQERIDEFDIEAKNGNEESIKAQEKLVKSLEKKLNDISDRELSLWEAQINPEQKIPPHIFQGLTEKLNVEREETEASLAKAREALSKPVDIEKKRVTFQKALDALLDDEVSIAEKNNLLKACISRMTYHRDPIVQIKGSGNGRKRTQPPIYLDIKLTV